MTTSTRSLAGVFGFSRLTGSWTFSETAAAVYRLCADDGAPTAERVLSRVHPEDRGAVERLWSEALTTGAAGAVWHRVCGDRGEMWQVVASVSGRYGGEGAVEAVVGHVVDVSDPLRRAAAQGVDDALAQISRSRPLIEQAKGVLMTLYSVGPDDAFGLLRAYSQSRNVKLREVARNVVESVASTGDLPPGCRPAWDRIADEVRGVASFPGVGVGEPRPDSPRVP